MSLTFEASPQEVPAGWEINGVGPMGGSTTLSWLLLWENRRLMELASLPSVLGSSWSVSPFLCLAGLFPTWADSRSLMTWPPLLPALWVLVPMLWAAQEVPEGTIRRPGPPSCHQVVPGSPRS